MINHRNKQNYRFRTWKFRDRCHLKGGVRQGCFLSLILNNLIQYIHFHSLYITSHYYAKFKENPCVGTDARPPLNIFDFTTAGDWDCVAAVERLPALHYSVDFVFLSFGIMGFIVEI